jgi:hypothetical protein
MPIKFPYDSILRNQNDRTPPKEIFQAVCDLIGEHYSSQNFRYARSRPKITGKGTEFDIEIAFWSSGSNMAGSYVNLEIIGHAYSKRLAKIDKEQGNTFKGFLLSHGDFWTKLNSNNPNGTVNTYLLDGKLVSERKEDLDYAIDRFNCNYNLYGITESQIDSIIEYIDKIFIEQINELSNKEGLIKFVENLPPRTELGRENERFYKFIELQHNNDNDILKVLKNKGITIHNTRL